MQELSSKDFIIKNHTSCNGCYFQHLRKVTCMDDSQQILVNDLFNTLGKCYSGIRSHIFVLKNASKENSTYYKRTKPFPVKGDVIEIISIRELIQNNTVRYHESNSTQ